MIDINIKNLKKIYLQTPIFEDINLELQKGEKVALIGENGTGKTTVFKIITGEEEKTDGQIFIRKNAKIGHLKQIAPNYEGCSVKQVLLMAFEKINTIKTKMTQIENLMSNGQDDYEKHLKEYGRLQEEYEVCGGYDIEEKLSKICQGLNFNDEFLVKNFTVLSGGEKTRVELGKLLLEEPDILLLDEPTNHLDMKNCEWLEDYLKNYKGSVLIISHDRYFLDKVIDRIYEIKLGKTEVYFGNFSYYLTERELRYNNQLKCYNQQQRKISQMEDAVKRFKDWGTQADNEEMFAKARAMEKRIEKLEKIDKPVLDTKGIKLNLNTDDKIGKEIFNLKNFELYIHQRKLIDKCDFTMFQKERLGIIGDNGCGKSTLVKCILGCHNMFEGEITLGPSVKTGYIEQNISFDNEDVSILEHFRNLFCISEGEIRKYLAKFKFVKEDVFKKIKNLSGGEKVRLVLAKLMHENINFLVLDEPTNHIDIKTKEILEDTLLKFEGSILFVSHDRFLLNKLATRIIEIAYNKINVFNGNYDYYKGEKEKMNYDFEEKSEKIINRQKKEKPKSIKVNVQRQTIIENEIARLEHEIGTKKSEIEKYSSDYQLVSQLAKDIEELEILLEENMNKWYEIIN